MNILIVSQYYYPEQFLINEIAPTLVKRGHKVTVLCGLPNYPKGRIFKGYEKSNRKTEIIEGVRIVRCWLLGRKSGTINLVLNYASFALSATLKILKFRDKFDIVFAYQMSPITLAIPALIFAKKRHIPSLIYCMDLWPESVATDINKKNGIIFRSVHYISKKIYNGFNKVAVSSKSFIDYLHKVNGVSEQRINYLPQHANSSMCDMDLSSERGEMTNFMFAGNLGTVQNLSIIVKAAEVLGKRGDYRIHFVGDGSFRKELEEIIQKKGLNENFIFHGFQDSREMPNFYKLADALLITLRGGDAVGLTLPSKFQTYLTTGKPIFGALNGDGNAAIKEAKCGDSVDADDYKGLAHIMEKYIENPEYYKYSGENGRIFFSNNFTLDKFIERLEDLMKTVIDETKTLKING